MGLEHRPYIGSWTMGSRKVIQHTPDALVYINGDMSVPGCVKCNSYINIQEFITSVSVDAGTDAAGASSSISLSVPVHHLDSFARDAQFILRPGLEVHVYQRGYFPVKGMFSNLAGASSPEKLDVQSASGPIQEGAWTGKYNPNVLLSPSEGPLEDLPPDVQDNLWAMCYNMETIDQYFAARAERGDFGSYESGSMQIHVGDGYATGGHADNSQHYKGNGLDFNMQYVDEKGRTHMVPKDDTWAGLVRMRQAGAIEHGGIGSYNNADTLGNPTGSWYVNPHYDRRGKDANWNRRLMPGAPEGTGGYAPTKSMNDALSNSPLPGEFPNDVHSYKENEQAKLVTPQIDLAAGGPPQEPNWQPSPLDQMGMSDKDLENLLAYPYYHTFHGIVTQVSFSWSPGVQEITLQCASMLHFWQYHQMSTNASVFGARPHNSKSRVSMVGHNFTGMHPYEIMYTLHHDTAGAAGGVSWALSQKTNQKARSPITGETLFGMNLRYWQQRFNQRETKLRLHGVTGGLFNSAQAAWLSRKKSGVLTKLIRERYNLRSDRRAGDIVSESLMEALIWGRAHAGKPGSDKPALELNAIEMEAFVTDISQWGNIQLFESTYESKLDIAQKVCEVTGFEFYQDVDGDFVFKPPMYNLDTSNSRVYRIEDIDLISINFDEKEPEVTYMTVKGSGFKNVLGTGVENEWGKQGQYIDYRLVAQFGWRPGNYEAEYFNDRASMFFAAVNRLDIMNAPVKSASATVPVRPEIRPGYPVYISYLDCFYYCPSFAHSYQVGGQCTTTLQLIAKRAKFYAPGDPVKGGKGIEAINLGYPAFPPMPLQVEDFDGRPRLKGFPNVVMALDPNQLNPTFFMVGADIDLMDTAESLSSLLKMAVELNVLGTKDKGSPGPEYWMETNVQDGQINFWYDSEGGQEAPEGYADIRTVAEDYQKARIVFQESQAELTKQMLVLMEKVVEADDKLRAVQASPKRTKAKEEKAIKATVTAHKNLRQVEENFEAARKAFDTSGSKEFPLKGTFLKLIREVGSRFFSSKQFGTAYGDPNATSTMLDMLSDKKATMTNGDMPGMFRYYSASHPHKEHQGQPPIKKTGSETTTVTPFITGARPVPTFVPSGQLQVLDTSSTPPDAKLEDREPIWGLRVLTNRVPQGEFVPTSEIRQLMFGVHQIHLLTKRGTGGTKYRKVDLGLGIGKRINGSFFGDPKATWKNDPTGMIPLAFLNSILVQINAALNGEGEDHNGSWMLAAKEIERHGYPISAVPKLKSIGVENPVLVYRGVTIDLTKPLSTYLLADTVGTELMFPGSDRYTAYQVWQGMTEIMSRESVSKIKEVKTNWFKELDELELPTEIKMAALNELYRGLQHSMGDINRRIKTVRTRKSVPWRKTIHSPVFPVSDSQGYEVIGSYRYGRDVNIDPDGVFDVLTKQDPLLMLDRKLLEELTDQIDSGTGIWAEKVVKDVKSSTGGEVTVKEFIGGTAATSDVERRVIEALRKNLTDKQILDLGWAKATGDPDVLQLDLRNWILDKTKDGLQKIPLVNAGYSLGDLQIHSGGNICRCKAAEADVLLHVAGEDDFVAVAASGAVLPDAWGDSDLDPITRWEMIAAAQSAPAWEQAQEALRGVRPIVDKSSIVKSFQDLSDTYSDWKDDISQRAETLEAQSEAMYNQSTQAIEDSIEAFGEEDD